MENKKVTTLDEFIVITKQEMKRRNMNQYDLADLTGVPKSTLGKILCGITKYPQEKTVDAIAKGLDIDISEIEVFKSKIPHNRFNPNTYFKNIDFDTYLNESLEKANEAREQLDNVIGLLLTIKQGIKSNEKLQDENSNK